ncbi:hypothetical protein V5O48_008971, partial [Marasmius crinis-equi]
EIAVLQLRLNELQREKDIAEANISHCRAALSAQRRLPAEIWEMIFIAFSSAYGGYSLDLEQAVHDENKKLLSMLPTVLSQVCVRWRNIVINVPKLWSSIRVDLGIWNAEISLPISTYLANSKDCLLSICIKLHHSIPSEQGHIALNMLSHHLRRCEKLTTDISYSCLPELPQLTLQALEHLSVARAVAVRQNDTHFWLLHGLRAASQYPAIPPGVPHSTIPYSQLRSLEIRYLESGNRLSGLSPFIHFLSSCKQLEVLAIGGVCEDMDIDIHELHTFSVELPLLRELALSDDSDADATPIVYALLGCLVMPSLIDFKLDVVHWPDFDALNILCQVQRSPRLERVELSIGWLPVDIPAAHTRLISFLRMLSCLRELRFTVENKDGHWYSHSSYAETVFSMLLSELHAPQTNSEQPVFLGKLEIAHLKFSDVKLDSTAADKVLAVAASRAGVSPLKEFTFYGMRRTEGSDAFELGIEMVRRIEELAKRGVRVHIGDVGEKPGPFDGLIS